MKIEQLLVQHFYKQREVTLQGIGTFSLSPDFVLPMDNDKDAIIPENAISFKFDPKAAEDDALISHIVEQTRKMRPLAAADLDSYLVLGKQFLNIGKPFKIEGLGMLLKNQQGEYQFTQGQSLSSKPEEAPPALVKEKLEEADVSFGEKSGGSSGSRNLLKVAATLLVLGIVGTAVWYFFLKDKGQATVSAVKDEPATQPLTDSTQLASQPTDSATTRKDSVAVNVPVPVSNGSYTFRVVFRVMSQGGALKKKEELNKANVIMYTTDSVHYKLAETFSLPLSDTTRIKDSLRTFYAFRTFVEVNN